MKEPFKGILKGTLWWPPELSKVGSLFSLPPRSKGSLGTLGTYGGGGRGLKGCRGLGFCFFLSTFFPQQSESLEGSLVLKAGLDGSMGISIRV